MKRQDWLQRYPNHPQSRRFQQLVELGRSLEHQLMPLGIVHSDWHRNTQTLAGTSLEGNSFRQLLAALTTWRTLRPRRAHDEIATIFLKNGASMWLIRTNQVVDTPRSKETRILRRTNPDISVSRNAINRRSC